MATLVCDQTTNLNMGLGKMETRLGEDVVTAGFTEELEHYRDKADPADQQKCSELLSSLHHGQELQAQEVIARRPKTAMAALGMPDMGHVSRPYETTYQREYVPRPDANVRAVRPMTSQGFAAPEGVPQDSQVTQYGMEFHRKNQRPASPYRTGTSSGNRANKPHPLKPFLVWRFPSNAKKFPPTSPWSEEVTNEKLNQVTKRMCRTTYQNDYLGIPQGFQVKSAFGNLPPDWKERVPYTLHSLQRSSYLNPRQQPELRVPTNRYGSNSNKHLASSGAIPSANLRAVDLKTRTTYDRHFNDLAPDIAHHARDVNRLLAADVIRLQHEKPFARERARKTTTAETHHPCHLAAGGGGDYTNNNNNNNCYYYEPEYREAQLPPSPPPTPPPAPYYPPSRERAAAASSLTRTRPRAPAATTVTMGYGTNYDTFQHKIDHPSPAPSHISVPYSPPVFLN